MRKFGGEWIVEVVGDGVCGLDRFVMWCVWERMGLWFEEKCEVVLESM